MSLLSFTFTNTSAIGSKNYFKIGVTFVLTDPKAIKIIQAAKQKNVRDPRRSRVHFENILSAFFSDVTLDGRYLDLGPGQFDFGELAREQGGTCMGVDFDPPVLELGRYKGFDTLELNLKALPKHDFDETFDGVFNKFALNAFWTGHDADGQLKMAQAIDALIKPGGWGWLAPWNGAPKATTLSQKEQQDVLNLQKDSFEACGFETVVLTRAQLKAYGVNGNVANNVVYIKNLSHKP
jgi:hypothetical protein